MGGREITNNPETAWGHLKKGVMIFFQRYGLIHYRLVFVRESPSYDGKTKACLYKRKGHMFTFPQAVGYSCPPINQETCMVDTRYIMPPACY